MLFRSLLGAFVLAAVPAAAQDYNRADVVRGLCQPDGCDEFSIASNEVIRQVPEGTLRKLYVRTYHASHSGRQERAASTTYVYCSPLKPAIIVQKGQVTKAFMLAPFATEDSPETRRKQTTYFAVYFAACHGTDMGRSAVKNPSGVAQVLRYTNRDPRSLTADLARPEDIISAGQERPAARSAPPLRFDPETRSAPEYRPPRGIPEDEEDDLFGDEPPRPPRNLPY